MPTLTFRPATPADIPALTLIRLAVTENVLSNPARVTPQMYADYLDRLGRGWVCEQQGAQTGAPGVGIIGFSYAAQADGSIWALFVRPGSEGLGAGRELLRLASAWLFSQGHAAVTLSTQARTRADAFYAAQGWLRGEMKDDSEVFFTLARPEPVKP
jgi:GNAT superfamily N-acetyltransferase